MITSSACFFSYMRSCTFIYLPYSNAHTFLILPASLHPPHMTGTISLALFPLTQMLPPYPNTSSSCYPHALPLPKYLLSYPMLSPYMFLRMPLLCIHKLKLFLLLPSAFMLLHAPPSPMFLCVPLPCDPKQFLRLLPLSSCISVCLCPRAASPPLDPLSHDSSCAFVTRL